MSGSGSGSSRRRSGTGGSAGAGVGTGGPSGGSSSGGAVDCSRLIFETTVGSPDPAVLAELTLGSVCDVVLMQNPTQIVVMAPVTGHVLGAIVNRWEELLGCLEKGVRFVAEIRSVHSPVTILVRPAF
jgi:hypothetical protein